jgi:hypothetical protein
LEVVGLGLAIPNPTTGSLLPMLPTIESGEDTIMGSGDADPPVGTTITNDYTSSLMIYPWEIACMKVWAAVGLVRISGTIYAAETITLSESSLGDLACGAPIEEIHEAVAIAAAHASLYRIDNVVVGSDGVIDVLTGTPSTSPTAPDTPSGHVSCGTILIYPNATAIYQYQINRDFVPAAPLSIMMAVADGDLAYAEHSTTLTVTIKDQYNNPYTISQVSVTVSFDKGTGDVGGGSTATKTTAVGSNQVVFTYHRNLNSYTYTLDPDDPVESSPLLRATLVQNPSAYTYGAVILRDNAGNFLP